jgi:drug/metabolite transporter (DMT)-like permease
MLATTFCLPYLAAMLRRQHTIGITLVALSALLWSFGGSMARFITVDSSWTVIFWRSYFATVFLLVFMVLRDGPEKTLELFRGMGWPGLSVASCFALASTCFVVALSYTTVANILLIQAGVPLLAALLAWLLFGEKSGPATWIAIAAVIVGIAVMTSETLTGKIAPIGDGLAVLIALAFAIATVQTRRHAHVQMLPAVTLGTSMAAVFSMFMVKSYAIDVQDLGWLAAFGMINLGLGLAVFTLGARLVPAALAALIGTLEPILGPLWVWLSHAEVPGLRTIQGGAIVFAALFVHLLLDWWRGGSAKR